MKESTDGCWSESLSRWNGSKYQDHEQVNLPRWSITWSFWKVEPMDAYWNTGLALIIGLMMAALSWSFVSRIGSSSSSSKSKQHEGATRKPKKYNDANTRKEEFLARNRKVYGYSGTPGGFIDDWRPTELPGLQGPLDHLSSSHGHDDQEREIYLDYAGSALPTQTQLMNIQKDWSSSKIFANPHSQGPAASRSLLGMEQAKQRVLQHFDATPGRFASLNDRPAFASPVDGHVGYDMIFTSGTTEGLRLIAERFPWKTKCSFCHRQSIFLYAQNSHTSVMGMRNLATKHGGRFVCRSWNEITCMDVMDWDQQSGSVPGESCTRCNVDDYPNLLAVPAECNFGGMRLDVASIIQKTRRARTRWFTLVDVAKSASTGPVSLKQIDADFAVMSFYKLFGEPTGLGALLVKQSSIHLLTGQGHYQGGGSVDLMLPKQDICIPRSGGLASLVHGTCNFRGIQTLQHGFEELERRGGMRRIHEHATCLARELTQRLEKLRHGNGRRAIVISGAWRDPTLRDRAGPIVTLNVVRDDGSFVGYNEVSKLASLHRPPIQLRTGCFCNPGACQEALRLSDDQVLENFHRTGHVCGDHIDLVDGKPTGAIRISFGKDSLWEDMDTFVLFLQKTFISVSPTEPSLKTETHRTTAVQVSELYIFPIKSCAAQRVRRWKVELPSGKLKHDREFSLVDTSGNAIRLQTYPKMTTIEPTIDLESETLTVSAPGMRDLVINLQADSCIHQGINEAIKVCGNKCGGRLWGDYEVAEWFSSYLGVQCWLARFQKNKRDPQPQHQESTSARSTAVPRVGFANEQAILLISENAVGLLNDVLVKQDQRPVCSRHFRPNLVVRAIDSENGHVEDEWNVLIFRKNGLSFETKGSCARCAMVDFDPYSGKKGKTLRALATYRRNGGQITFGVFLQAMIGYACGQEDYWIEEGDEVLCK